LNQRELLKLAAAGERVEAAAYASMIGSAPERQRREGRATLREIGSATLFAIPGVPWPTPNRILGLGISEPATEEMVEEIVSCCDELKIPKFCVPVCSCAQPGQEKIVSWLSRHGFKTYNTWVKMHRGDEEPTNVRSDSKLVVRRIGKEESRDFARIAVDCFGYPKNYAEWLRAPVGKEGWHHFMAFLGKKPIGTGALFVQDRVGNLLLGSTLKPHRRLGSQSLLFHDRLTYGLDLGCRTFFTETHADTPEVPNPSYHNMIRAGFSVSYSRLNYLLERL
jgi:hypothetical protein